MIIEINSSPVSLPTYFCPTQIYYHTIMSKFFFINSTDNFRSCQAVCCWKKSIPYFFKTLSLKQIRFRRNTKYFNHIFTLRYHYKYRFVRYSILWVILSAIYYLSVKKAKLPPRLIVTFHSFIIRCAVLLIDGVNLRSTMTVNIFSCKLFNWYELRF